MRTAELLTVARVSVRTALDQCRWRNASAPETRAELDRKHAWFVDFARDRRPRTRSPLSWDTEVDQAWNAALSEYAGDLAQLDEPKQLVLRFG